MLRRCLVVAAALAVIVPIADAQKNCRKGIPCGNSCISPTKTCHINSAPPPAANPSTAPVAAPAAVTPPHRDSGGAAVRPAPAASQRNQSNQKAPATTAPQGATALCRDSTYSFSAHRSGTCAGHHGVAKWLRSD